MSSQGSLRAAVVAAFAAFVQGCGDGDSTTAEETSDPTGGGEEQLPPEDLDGDGFSEADGDCDDRNHSVYPGARERSRDGVDSDCDGEDLPALGDDLFDEALAAMDTDADQAISLDEFEAACAHSAMVVGEANPGVVQTHSDCGGTSSCRGMILHPWNELYEHDCRGVNSCAGWSCVETAAGSGRSGEVAFTEAHCDWCHAGPEGGFLVQVPEGEDPAAWAADFPGLSDARFRASIAFGRSGVSESGVASADMPAHYEVLSRAEMDAVIGYLRSVPLEVPSE